MQGSKPRGEVEFLTTKLEKVTLELKETKQNLEKSVEEGMVMATCLSILHKELEQTKQELQELKEKDLYFRYRSSPGPSDEVWVEKDVQHVVDEPKVEVMPIMKQKEEFEFQKNDVTFANEPSITKYIVPDENPVLVRLPSLKSTKKKKPLIAGIFSRRKGDNSDMQFYTCIVFFIQLVFFLTGFYFYCQEARKTQVWRNLIIESKFGVKEEHSRRQSIRKAEATSHSFRL